MGFAELFSFLIFAPILIVYGTCGGNISGQSGVISYPDPASLYPSNVDCTWFVTAPQNTKNILILFARFDISGSKSYQNRCEDYLQIFGENDNMMMNDCGQNKIVNMDVPGNNMKIIFHSDVKGSGQGFLFSWRAIKSKETERSTSLFTEAIRTINKVDLKTAPTDTTTTITTVFKKPISFTKQSQHNEPDKRNVSTEPIAVDGESDSTLKTTLSNHQPKETNTETCSKKYTAIIVVNIILGFGIFLLAVSYGLWRKQKHKRLRPNVQGNSSREDAHPNQAESHLSCDNLGTDARNFRDNSNIEIHMEKPHCTLESNYCYIEDHYDVLRNPREKKFDHLNAHLYGAESFGISEI